MNLDFQFLMVLHVEPLFTDNVGRNKNTASYGA